MMVAMNEFWENEAEKAQGRIGPRIEYARVVAIENGEPIITFSGENIPSQKTFLRLRSYEPVTGDRVMLINGIIIGGWAVSNPLTQ